MGLLAALGVKQPSRQAKRGALVVISARSQQGLESLVDEIRRQGGEATAVVADVSNFEQVKAIADKTVEQYGRLDTWVHNAAVELDASFEQTTPEEFKRLIDVNLMGQVYGAMVALPHLKREGRGALIHVSSVEAKRSLPLQSAYAAAKHGIDGFLESLRVELQHQKLPISVTNVMPASINTPLFDKARTKLGVKPQGVPPIYQPSLVADAILDVAEHPKRDVVVGDAGKMILLAQRISPSLVDAYMVRTAFEGQRTNEPKSQDAPDNLFEPIQGYNKTEGDFSEQARSWSF